MSSDSGMVSAYEPLSARETSASTPQSEGKSHPQVPLILGIIGIFFILVFCWFLEECTARRRKHRALKWWNRGREEQFRDAYGDLDVEAVQRDAEARGIAVARSIALARRIAVARSPSDRPRVGMATQRNMDGMTHGDVLTGDGGRLERSTREIERTVMVPLRSRTRTPLPRYTERDEGMLRVPEYERPSSLPAYGSGDLERAAWREEGRSDGHFGDVEVELQVLERAVLR